MVKNYQHLVKYPYEQRELHKQRELNQQREYNILQLLVNHIYIRDQLDKLQNFVEIISNKRANVKVYRVYLLSFNQTPAPSVSRRDV